MSQPGLLDKEKPESEAQKSGTKIKPNEADDKKPGKERRTSKTTESISEFKNKGRVFSLEIILDKLQLSYYTEFMNRCRRGTNCISFRFLKEGPFTICENKPVMPECAEKKTGASAMFTLTVDDMRRLRKEFCLQFEVYRNTPDEDIVFGTACMSLVNLFKCVCSLCDANEYRKALIEEEFETDPPPCPSRCMKEMVQETTHQNLVINAPEGSPCEEAAVLTIFLRLTCFGSMNDSEAAYEPPPPDPCNSLPKYICCCSAPGKKSTVQE